MDAINSETISQYFKLLKETLEQNKLSESSDLLSESHIPAEDDVSLSVLFYDVTPLEELPVATPGL